MKLRNLFSWFNRTKSSQPLHPDALKAINIAMTCVLWKHRSANPQWPTEFTEALDSIERDLQDKIRNDLKFLNLMKSPQQTAQEEIERILADPADPFHDREADFHVDRVIRMADLRLIVAGRGN